VRPVRAVASVARHTCFLQCLTRLTWLERVFHIKVPQRLKLHPGKTSPFPLSCRVESGDILIPDTYHKCLNYFKGNTLDSDSNRRGTPKIIAIHAKGLAEARNCIEHETTQLSELIQDLQHQNSTDLPFIYLFQVSTTLS